MFFLLYCFRSAYLDYKHLQYTLESCTESRSIGYIYNPYRGEDIKDEKLGQVPDPWSIDCSPEEFFTNESKKIIVPYTDSIQICYGCIGKGFVKCLRCAGKGHVICGSCGGSGRTKRYGSDPHKQVTDRCTKCSGSGNTGSVSRLKQTNERS